MAHVAGIAARHGPIETHVPGAMFGGRAAGSTVALQPSVPGAGVGGVGAGVGLGVGFAVGLGVGFGVGFAVGFGVGYAVGAGVFSQRCFRLWV